MEKARLDHIYRLLKITKRERHHKLLLSVKNLQDLGASLFLYIVPILPRPLLKEVVKGEHFVLADLLKSLLGGSSQAKVIPELLVRLDHLPLAAQDPKPGPQACSPSGEEEEEKEVRAVEGCRQGTGGVCGMDEYDG